MAESSRGRASHQWYRCRWKCPPHIVPGHAVRQVAACKSNSQFSMSSACRRPLLMYAQASAHVLTIRWMQHGMRYLSNLQKPHRCCIQGRRICFKTFNQLDAFPSAVCSRTPKTRALMPSKPTQPPSPLLLVTHLCNVPLSHRAPVNQGQRHSIPKLPRLPALTRHHGPQEPGGRLLSSNQSRLPTRLLHLRHLPHKAFQWLRDSPMATDGL